MNHLSLILFHADEILSKASETLRNHPLPAFDVVENLVEEEVGGLKTFAIFHLSPAKFFC